MKRASLHRSLHGSQYVPSDQASLPIQELEDSGSAENDVEDVDDPMQLEGDDQDENSGEGQPDLEDYFSQWDIPPRDIVGICRAYASYVAATTGCMRVKKD